MSSSRNYAELNWALAWGTRQDHWYPQHDGPATAGLLPAADHVAGEGERGQQRAAGMGRPVDAQRTGKLVNKCSSGRLPHARLGVAGARVAGDPRQILAGPPSIHTQMYNELCTQESPTGALA